MDFQCELKRGKRTEHWSGKIQSLKKISDKLYEISIVSRSSIKIVIGKASFGYFACAPDFRAGCHLVKYSDLFWNKESLIQALGKVDGATAAHAIEAVAKILEKHDEEPF